MAAVPRLSEGAFRLQLTWAAEEEAEAEELAVLALEEAVLRQQGLMTMMIVRAASWFVSVGGAHGYKERRAPSTLQRPSRI